MTDRLDAIKATLDRMEKCLYGDNDIDREDCDNVRWLVAEVRRLRQRHAEAVEKAFRAGYHAGVVDPDIGMPGSADAAWIASEARKGVAREA